MSTFDEVPLVDFYRAGFRLVLLDIDNTLMVHGQSGGNDQAKEKLQQVRRAGLQPILLSNAKRARAAGVAKDLDCPVIGMAMKPSPKGIYEALEQTGVKKDETLLIGDQIFTDVWAGRRAGIKTILVKPISLEHEPLQIRLKRKAENYLLRKFKVQASDKLAEL